MYVKTFFFQEVLISSLISCFLVKIRWYNTEINQKKRADKIASSVDLNNITQLEIQPKDDISQLHFIKEILL
jgi:hypothetical protein